MANSKFSLDELDWIGTRFLDPIGKVFYKDGYYYRAIYNDKVEFVKEILNKPSYNELIESGLLPKSEVLCDAIDGYGLLLKTKASPWKFKPSELPLSLLKKSSLVWIEINQILAKDNLGLIDAHFGNIAFGDHANPMWIDLGSIQPLSSSAQGFGEFINTQMNPLFAFAKKKKLNKLTRLTLDNGGINLKETLSFIGYHHITFYIVLFLPMLAVFFHKVGINSLMLRKISLWIFKKIISSINFKPSMFGFSTYFKKNSDKKSTDKSTTNTIVSFIEKVNPTSITELGANDGYFVKSLQKPGRSLLLVDPNEHVVNDFVDWIDTLDRKKNVTLFACLDSFYTLQYQSELVLALGLTHHVALIGKYKFDYISKRLSEVSSKSLIVDFMPQGLNAKVNLENLPDWYSLDVFLEQLAKYFEHVHVFAYPNPVMRLPKTLIYCDKKYVV